MKIAFYLENRNIPHVDLSQPEFGNPGCGGTEYLFVALPYYLSKRDKISYQPVIFANNISKLPDCIPHFQVTDVQDAARCAKEENCAFFVYRPRRQPDPDFLELIDRLKLPSIAWFHITPVARHLQLLAQSKYLKATICVEHEQCDLAQDTAIWSKLSCIVNGFDLQGFQLKDPPEKEPGLVVYIGALVPQKGFHLLARVWPRVLTRHPEARLAVIGSGALYNSKAKLGPWGVAESEYETQHIIPYLAAEDGQPHPSVEFLGRLGAEKKEYLYKAMVGVPNPGGQSENCPGSSIEIQACGTAVVTGAYFGLLDTVRNSETGLLGRSEDDLVNNICFLLEN